MQAAPLHELKKELKNKSPKDLLELVTRLARFKKENKELLTYLLFEAHDESSYILGIQNWMDEEFKKVNTSHLYFGKKSIRKILRLTNTYIRYSGKKVTQVELLIYFCRKMKEEIPFKRSIALSNLYNRQIEKIRKTITALHEDLQFDYEEELKILI